MNEAAIRCAGWLAEQPMAARMSGKRGGHGSAAVRDRFRFRAPALRSDGAVECVEGPPGRGDRVIG